MFINEPWLVPDPDDYDGFYEESQFDEMIYELKDALKKSVKKSILDEIESLRKRIAELEDFAKDKKKYDAEKSALRRELEETQRSINYKAAQMRLPEILKALESPAWIADWDYEYAYPKCDKCDKDRKIHFKSPSGRTLEEECSCAKKICNYTPVQGILIKFRWNKDSENHDRYHPEGCEIAGTRFEFIRPDTFKKTYVEGKEESFMFECAKFYNGEPFEELAKTYGRSYFRKLEDCQAYCDYKNKLEHEKIRK